MAIKRAYFNQNHNSVNVSLRIYSKCTCANYWCKIDGSFSVFKTLFQSKSTEMNEMMDQSLTAAVSHGGTIMMLLFMFMPSNSGDDKTD